MQVTFLCKSQACNAETKDSLHCMRNTVRIRLDCVAVVWLWSRDCSAMFRDPDRLARSCTSCYGAMPNPRHSTQWDSRSKMTDHMRSTSHEVNVSVCRETALYNAYTFCEAVVQPFPARCKLAMYMQLSSIETGRADRTRATSYSKGIGRQSRR